MRSDDWITLEMDAPTIDYTTCESHEDLYGNEEVYRETGMYKGAREEVRMLEEIPKWCPIGMYLDVPYMR